MTPIDGRATAGARAVPFLALAPGEDADAVADAIRRVVESGWFILGPEVEAFEREFAAASGAAHAVGVGTGTDAIALILRALGIGAGDEVITAPLSAAYSALAVMMCGARPVFADIAEARLTIDPGRIEAAITPRTRAILPVHIYGQPADMTAIAAIAARHRIAIVEDCCQAHLATCDGRPVGTFGAAGAFSFYPTKNLGALGDGGAVITGDASLADRIRRLRNGGQIDRYHHAEFGVNSRLDELQAAILRARLSFLPRWTARRRELAGAYRRALTGASIVVPPELDPGHVYHLFPIRTRDRAAAQAALSSQGVGTLVHYPVPLPRQPAIAAATPDARQSSRRADARQSSRRADARQRVSEIDACPVADRACGEVLSLPLYPALTEADVARVAAAVTCLPR